MENPPFRDDSIYSHRGPLIIINHRYQLLFATGFSYPFTIDEGYIQLPMLETYIYIYNYTYILFNIYIYTHTHTHMYMCIYIYIYYSKAPSRRPANPPVLNHGPRRAHRLPLMNPLIGTSNNGTTMGYNGYEWILYEWIEFSIFSRMFSKCIKQLS